MILSKRLNDRFHLNSEKLCRDELTCRAFALLGKLGDMPLSAVYLQEYVTKVQDKLPIQEGDVESQYQTHHPSSTFTIQPELSGLCLLARAGCAGTILVLPLIFQAQSPTAGVGLFEYKADKTVSYGLNNSLN